MFDSREDAAHKLTLKLLKLVKDKNAVVIALARGAVPMGKIIASYFSFPFDILVVKKIGAPVNPEFALGVITPKNTVFWNREITGKIKISEKELLYLRKTKEKERLVLEKQLRGNKKELNLKGKTIILIDDGVATGTTVMGAQAYLRKTGAKKIILATPVIAQETYKEIKKYFDQLIALKKVSEFYAVGQSYRFFPQVTNQEVIKILKN